MGTWPAHHTSSEVGWLVLLILIPLTGFGWWVAGWNTTTSSLFISLGWWGFAMEFGTLLGPEKTAAPHLWGWVGSLVAALAARLTLGCFSPFMGVGVVGVVVVVWLGCVVVC